MRATVTLLFLAACVLMIMAYKAIHQELHIRSLRNQIKLDTDGVTRIEEEILSAKTKIQNMNGELGTLNKQKDELTKKKEELVKAQSKSESSLVTCQEEKAQSEKTKTEATESLKQLKTDQNAEEQKMQEEMQNLQTMILNRDIKICSYVDPKLEEGRKLCEEKMAAQINPDKSKKETL